MSTFAQLSWRRVRWERLSVLVSELHQWYLRHLCGHVVIYIISFKLYSVVVKQWSWVVQIHTKAKRLKSCLNKVASILIEFSQNLQHLEFQQLGLHRSQQVHICPSKSATTFGTKKGAFSRTYLLKWHLCLTVTLFPSPGDLWWHWPRSWWPGCPLTSQKARTSPQVISSQVCSCVVRQTPPTPLGFVSKFRLRT